MTTTATTPTTLAPVPMPAEQVEAHVKRIEHLLADLEAAVNSLHGASWGHAASPDHTTARFLADGTVAPLHQWLDRIGDTLTEVCEQSDLYGWDT